MALADLNRNQGNIWQKGSVHATFHLSTADGTVDTANLYSLPRTSDWTFDKAVSTTTVTDTGGDAFQLADTTTATWSATVIQQDIATIESFMIDLENQYIMMVQEMSKVQNANSKYQYLAANIQILGGMTIAAAGGTIPLTGQATVFASDKVVTLSTFDDGTFLGDVSLATITIKAGQSFGVTEVSPKP